MSAASGLRERKKMQTRWAIATAARHLAIEHGVDGFTVDDVAARADVSPRTFFNYFASKEDAIIGVDPARLDELTAQLLARPARESPLLALRNTMFPDDSALAENAASFAARIELAHRHPALMPRHLAATHELEQRLIAAMGQRLGVDPSADPYPTVVVSAGMAALRSVMLWWQQHDQPGLMSEHVDAAFRALGNGLRRPRD